MITSSYQTTLVVVVAVVMIVSTSLPPGSVASPRPFVDRFPGHTHDHLRRYFRCDDCSTRVCPATPPGSGGCELVRELGVCSCCLVCARGEGARCGVYTEPCGHGLKCWSPDPSSIEALFYGEGVCRKSRSDGGHFEVRSK